MGLKLKLRPGERCVINGAVIENAGARTTLTVHNFAQVMRGASILQEDDANTPAKRVYFTVQAMLLDSACADRHRRSFNTLMAALVGAIRHPDMQDALREVVIHVDDADYYRALQALRPVIDHEADVLGKLTERRHAVAAVANSQQGGQAHDGPATACPGGN